MINTPMLADEPPLAQETWRKFVNLLLPAAAFEAVMGTRNLLVLERPGNLIMFGFQICMAVFFLASWWMLRRHASFTYAQSQRALTVGLLLMVALPLEQALSGNGMLVANLSLVVVFTGAILTDTRLFTVVMVALLGSWALAVSTADSWNPPVGTQIAILAVALALAVALHVMRVWDRLNLRRAWNRAIHHSMRDDLTGLWNRRGVREVLMSMVGGMRTTGMGMWCVFLDVRGLKAVNDTRGHAEGDRVLRAIGKVFNQTQGMGMVPCRWGGDEFCLFGPAVLIQPETLVGDLRERIRAEVGDGRDDWDLSFGWASQDAIVDDNVIEDLVRAADMDMYRRRAELRAE